MSEYQESTKTVVFDGLNEVCLRCNRVTDWCRCGDEDSPEYLGDPHRMVSWVSRLDGRL